ncbi:MAG: ZIP family metal transporter, partial [Bacteroidales bacterium]|nr:ZIP family metal transporter [Bacteroidales bacterium]
MNIIVLSILAGVGGTGLGGLLTVIFGSRTDKMISVFLAFAGGIMTSIVFFELIPEALLHADVLITIAGLLTGIILVMLLENLIDRVSNFNIAKPKLHENYEDFFHVNEIITGRKSMLRSGIMMFFVIGLHNIPEGLAIGTACGCDLNMGATLALIIAIHNIPEGMAISAPLLSGGLKKVKTVILTMLSGLPTALGAFLGILFGTISNTALALSFSIAGGAMLYVV